jgi:acetylornithine deacetylase
MKDKYLWDISQKLIAFDTVSFKTNSPCANFLANQLEDIGFKVYIEQFNDNGILKEQVIARIGPEVEDGLIFSGHIDTVPFEKQLGWSKDPLKLTVENDKLFGRGTTDMKLFIAHCLAAFKEMDLSKLKKPIVCIFTADEEIGCLGAKRLVKKVDSLIEKMPLPSKAIIGEPTSFNIINTHKGIVHFDLLVKGIAGHSSRPDLGHNAIEDLGIIIELIKEMNSYYQKELDPDVQKVFPDFPYNHLHMAMIKSGEALNMIPDVARLSISYRCFPMDPPLKVYEELKTKIQSLGLKHKVEIENLFATPGLKLNYNEKFVSVLKEITSGDVQSVSFATDAGYLSQADIECYICGPGTIKMAHQPDEYMDLSDYLQGKKFIQDIVNSCLI